MKKGGICRPFLIYVLPLFTLHRGGLTGGRRDSRAARRPRLERRAAQFALEISNQYREDLIKKIRILVRNRGKLLNTSNIVLD
jgi:hypothetical protein